MGLGKVYEFPLPRQELAIVNQYEPTLFPGGHMAFNVARMNGKVLAVTQQLDRLIPNYRSLVEQSRIQWKSDGLMSAYKSLLGDDAITMLFQPLQKAHQAASFIYEKT